MRLQARSLRARLWQVGAIGIVLAALAASWGLGEAFARATLANFDSRLADDLLTITGLVERGPDNRVLMQREPTDDRYWRALSGHYWVVLQETERFRSRSLWDAEIAFPELSGNSRLRFVRFAGPLGQDLRAAVQQIRIGGMTTPVTVLAASDASEAYARIREFRWYAGLSAAGLVVLLLAIVAYQVSYGLRPMREIVTTLALVRAGEDRRLEPDAMPAEVRPLAHDINDLLDHQERMIRRARNAAGDLAHALKTPLAVLGAAAQHPSERMGELVAEQTARMQATIDRQLAVAVVGNPRSRTPLAEVAPQLVSLMHRVHADRALDIEIDMTPGAVFRGERDDLEEMLGNLLDNACKWARARVKLSVAARSGRLRLVVDDDGPGMAPNEMQAALRRGVRFDERVTGSGLGLAIVLDLAESYGGGLTLHRSPLGGLAAELELPAA
jgi:signal transduction histidine kinase